MTAVLLAALAFAQAPAKEVAWEAAPRTKEYAWMSTDTWKKLHESHLAISKKGYVDVAFLGDSITQGWGNNGPWKKHFVPLKAANYGIGGDTTQNVLWRLEHGAFDGISPKAVVLMIGTNNFGLAGDNAADTAKGIGAVVAAIRKKTPDAKILLLAIFPRDEKPGTAMRKKIAETNAAIEKLADGKNVVYLDIGPKFLKDDGTLPKDLMPDFLHVSEKGYEIWAEAISDPLAKLLAK